MLLGGHFGGPQRLRVGGLPKEKLLQLLCLIRPELSPEESELR